MTGCGGADSGPPSQADDGSGGAGGERQVAELRRELRGLRRQKRTPQQRERRSASSEIGAGLPGEVGFYIGAPAGGGVGGGTVTTGSAWSTIKVPIAIAVLERAGGPQGASAEQLDLIRRALTASDNEAAASLFAELGATARAAEAVTDILRQGGDSHTTVSTQGRDGFSPYGQTDWPLEEQARFMAALDGGCVSSPSTRRYILGLMSEVTSDLWGLGSAPLPARWKGGWGPEPSGRYLLRQMGLVEARGQRVPVALAALPTDGTFESGQELMTQLGRELEQKAGLLESDPASC